MIELRGRQVAVAALFVGAAAAAWAQRAPGAPEPEQVRARIAAVQAELSRNQSGRDRVERELRDLQSQIERLRVEQQRLQAEQARLQSELSNLQSAAR